ncbi:helix-turn-helix transcriptional regulator [Enterococcus mundtii]|uniref:Cro/Cl family transcriptional regulator n=1 Tax=Enterococcus mundtii TaxID=53346 RepID=A0AAI8R676_ENTMU|nr:helix-turn-helix transcriptional regulator [Enterococcus mundtii]BBM13545.1 Cro/Cl family transcriptional regulator [Enterococcus mundtii]
MEKLAERLTLLREEKEWTKTYVAKQLNLNNLGTYANWEYGTREPDNEMLTKIASLYNVSTDYLLGRSEKRHYYDLTKKDEKDIATEIENMIADLKNADAFAYSKEASDIDRETHELLIASLENSLRIAKIEAKKRFTPKKYRN